MPKIKDLGINAIPEMTRPLEIGDGGFIAACPEPTTRPGPPPPCPEPTTRPGPPPPCPEPTTITNKVDAGSQISYEAANQLREELRKHL